MNDSDVNSDVNVVEVVDCEEKPTDLLPFQNDNIVSIAENAERRVDAIKKIKVLALKVTNSQDWVNQGGKPYLQATGSEKVARLFGISWRIEEPAYEVFDDGHFQYTYKGNFSMQGSEIQAIGTRSSKDSFFSATYKYIDGEKKKIVKPPSEISRGDVKKSAYTNCIGNGVTRILGIRNLMWEDIKSAGINVEKVSKVEYGKAEMSEENKTKRKKIAEMLMAMSDNDPKKASEKLVEFTSFIASDGKEVKGKSKLEDLSEKAIPVVYGKVKDAYNELKGDNDSGS